jgi:hypothetical protein
MTTPDIVNIFAPVTPEPTAEPTPEPTPTPAGPGLLGGLVPTPPVETDSEGGEA